MNTAILISSFRFLHKYELISSLSIWIDTLLFESKQDKDQKFKRSCESEDYEVSKLLVMSVTRNYYLDSDYKFRYKVSIAEHTDLLTAMIERNIIFCLVDIMTYSCRYGYADTVKLLIDTGYKVNKDGKSVCLMHACVGQHMEIVKTLLDAGATSEDSIKIAITKEDDQLLETADLKRPLRCRFCKDIDLLEQALIRLIPENKIEAVKVILKPHNTIRSSIVDSMILVCYKKSLYEMTQLLIDSGAKIDYDSFDFICELNDSKMFNLLKSNNRGMYCKWLFRLNRH